MGSINQFRLERLKKGMSQDELAAKMNVPQCTISRIEIGKTKPRMRTMKKWATAMGIDYLQALRIVASEPRPDEEKMVDVVK